MATWGTTAVGSSGIAEADEGATAEVSGRFVEESGSKPRVLRSACAPCSEKWTNQYLTSAVQEGLEVDIDVGPPACRGHFPDTKEERHCLVSKSSPFLLLTCCADLKLCYPPLITMPTSSSRVGPLTLFSPN